MSSTIAELFEQAGDRMLDSDPGVQRDRIMNSIGLKTAGKFFAFVRRDELVLKLPAERVRELIDAGDGAPFDAGKGRPMKEWAGVRPADEAACAGYIDEARRFVAGLARR
jgi:hypothetical protein